MPLEKKAQPFESVARVAQMLSATLDLSKVLDGIVHAATELILDSSSRIWVVEDDRLVLRSEAGTLGPPRSGRKTSFAFGEGLTGQAALRREPLIVEDVLADPRTINVEWMRQEGYVSLISIPLVVRDRLVGALSLLTRHRHSFSPVEVEVLSSFCTHAAIAIENARLFGDSRARQARLETLLDVSRGLSRIQPVESLLQSIAEACGHLLGVDSVGFRLLEGNELVVTATWGDAKETMPTPRLKMGESLSGRVAVSGEPLLVRDPAQDPRLIPAHREAMGRLGFQAALVVPVKLGERVVGILSIHTRRPHGFAEEDVTVATAFASQAAIALENSRLYQETQRLLVREQTSRAAAEASEARFRELMQDLEAIVWEAEAETFRFSFVSQRAEALLGYPTRQWFREPDFWLMHMHPEDRDRTLARVRVALSAGEDYSVEYRMVAGDGRAVWLRDRVHVVRDAQGKPSRLRGVTVDITYRKRTEEALHRLSRQHQLILTSAGEGIYGLDAQGLTTFINPAAAAMLGWTPEELIGQPQHAMIHHSKPDGTPYPQEECPIYAALKDGRMHHVGNEVFWRKGGTSFPVEYTSTPIRDEGGDLIGAVVTFRDISQRQELEAQLRQAQKMEAIGCLAGGIAHDFNNLLTVVMGRCQLMLGRLEAESPLRRDLDLIDTTVQRAATLTQQLLAFSRKQVLQPKVLDLNAVVANIDPMFRRLIGEDIKLVTVLDPALGPVKADPAQLEQVILNLAVNSRDAMPEGGRLTIETANVELDATYARRHAGASPGAHVMLAVSDTGCGMDAATQARLFEPFFTTKGPGKGTGLGLSTVYGIINQSGGNIWVYSEAGRGTTFKIYLPRVEESVELEVVQRDTAVAKSPKAFETVLLVEDEHGVRDLVRDILEENGYTVLEARDGAEAIHISGHHAGPIHLLLTDVVMPHISGRTLVERLSPVRPEMRILYMSGYSENAIHYHGVLEAGTAYLQKPFTAETLVQKMREVLETIPRKGEQDRDSAHMFDLKDERAST
jgi:PAS domain S-box-containing protein